MSQALRRPPTRRVEWEFDKVTFSREFPRTVVTKLLVERAEHGGWELDRVRITADGPRRVILRRRIIKADRTACPSAWLQQPRSTLGAMNLPRCLAAPGAVTLV